jgi:hypothetical protein
MRRDLVVRTEESGRGQNVPLCTCEPGVYTSGRTRSLGAPRTFTATPRRTAPRPRVPGPIYRRLPAASRLLAKALCGDDDEARRRGAAARTELQEAAPPRPTAGTIRSLRLPPPSAPCHGWMPISPCSIDRLGFEHRIVFPPLNFALWNEAESRDRVFVCVFWGLACDFGILREGRASGF